MKKNFITTFFACVASLLMAFTLTACDSDIPGINPDEKVKTIFSMEGNDATRTGLDDKGNFSWGKGDKIWIDTGTDFVWSSQSNITKWNQAKAKFVVDANLTGNSYKVLYTGYGESGADTTKTYYDKVTIRHTQTQYNWNDGAALGAYGDCGTGIAYKQTGAPGYKFTIDHKASYLVLYPYLDTSLSGSYKLQKIEILSNLSASNIAGTFSFDFNYGLLNSDGTPKTPLSGTGKQQITVSCNTTNAWQLRTDVPDVTSTTATNNHVFAVIAPGTHQLTLKYYVTSPSNETLIFVKDLALTKYEPNGVYRYIHKLQNEITAPQYEYEIYYYKWGAMVEGYDGVYDTSTTELTDGFWATLPNITEMSWYLQNGNLYWDNATQWINKRTGATQRGGLWVKKSSEIPGFSSTTARGTITRIYPILGRPTSGLHTKWFFLPAYEGNITPYWTKSPYGNTGLVYVFNIGSDNSTAQFSYKENLRLAYIKAYYNGSAVNMDAPWYQ